MLFSVFFVCFTIVFSSYDSVGATDECRMKLYNKYTCVPVFSHCDLAVRHGIKHEKLFRLLVSQDFSLVFSPQCVVLYTLSHKGTLSSWPACTDCPWEAVWLSGHLISGCQLHHCSSTEQGVDKCSLCYLSSSIILCGHGVVRSQYD